MRFERLAPDFSLTLPLFEIEGGEPEWTWVDLDWFDERRVAFTFLRRSACGAETFFYQYAHNGKPALRRFSNLNFVPIPIQFATMPIPTPRERIVSYD